jgi:hypothetical protein
LKFTEVTVDLDERADDMLGTLPKPPFLLPSLFHFSALDPLDPPVALHVLGLIEIRAR